MQIPPAENIFAKGAFCAFYKTSTYGDSFTVVKNKFIAVHIPDVFKIYYDSSVAHKEIIPVIKQHYKFGKCTAHRLFGFVRTMNMYAVLKMLSIPVTIFWIVGITNTVNLIDGLDGLAAGISAIAALTLTAVALFSKQYATATLLMCVAGGAVGFLPHNFNPAKIFMGDTGSLFLGFILSVAAVEGTIKGATVVAVVIPLFALAIPILDTTFAIIRRYLAGKPIMEADKGHLHHRLLAKGLSQKKTVVFLYAIAAVLGASSLLILRSDYLAAALVIIADALLILFGVKKLKILEEVKTNEKN